MLKGKSVIVTGSTSGIGLAIARAFAKEGCNITINGFGDKDAIEKERAGIEKDFGVKAIYSGADMTKPAEIADMVKLAEKTFGAVDVLDAGVVHQDVDAAQLGDCFCDEATHVAGIRHVRQMVGRLQLGPELLDFRGITEAVQHDARALRRQRPRDAEADAARRAGDERNFSVETHSMWVK